MIKAITGNKSFDIESSEEGVSVNGASVLWDIVHISGNYYHIIYQNRSYNLEVLKIDVVSKTLSIKINGTVYPVAVKDQFDLLLEKLGMSAASAARVNNVKAPMPGLIVDLKVKEGDAVKTGDTLLILEAMKMENIIKATGEAVVKSVKAKKGDSVEKNQVLIEF